MNEFDLDPNMSEDDALDFLSNLMIRSKLAYIATNMQVRLSEALHMPLIAVTPEYVDRIACAAYAISMGTPFTLIKLMGGPVQLASLMLTNPISEIMSPSKLTEKLRNGMASMTPKAAELMSEEAVIQAAKLCLLDWLDAGDDLTKDKMQMDSHLYFVMVMQQRGITPSVVRHELKNHADSLGADDYLGLPTELRQYMENWDWENDRPFDTAN